MKKFLIGQKVIVPSKFAGVEEIATVVSPPSSELSTFIEGKKVFVHSPSRNFILWFDPTNVAPYE